MQMGWDDIQFNTCNWMHTHTKKGIWIKTTVGAARSAIDDVSGVFIAPLIAVTASPANSHCTSYLSQGLQKISSHSHVHKAPLSTTVAICNKIEGLAVGGSELRSTVVYPKIIKTIPGLYM